MKACCDEFIDDSKGDVADMGWGMGDVDGFWEDTYPQRVLRVTRGGTGMGG